MPFYRNALLADMIAGWGTVPLRVTFSIIKNALELDGVMIELDRIAER